MRSKIRICSLLMLLTTATFAQSESDKNLLVGNWQAETFSYGDYYSYSVKDDKISVNEKLNVLMQEDSKRFDKAFMEIFKKKATAYINLCSFVLNRNGTYSLTMGGKTKTGSYTFIPLYIKPRQGSIEEDVTHNVTHEDDLAILSLSGGETISISKFGDKLDFFINNPAKSASNYGFSAGIHFRK